MCHCYGKITVELVRFRARFVRQKVWKLLNLKTISDVNSIGNGRFRAGPADANDRLILSALYRRRPLEFAPLRTVIFRGWGQDLGGQLDYRRDSRECERCLEIDCHHKLARLCALG